MKKKILIYSLVGLSVVGVLLLFTLVSYYFYQTAVPGIITFCVLSAIYGCVVLVRKLISLQREKKFINNMLNEQGKKSDTGAPDEVATRWRETVEEIRKSDLRHRGNPLYVLPWYMLIGESGSGKTTAIKNSRLSSNYASQRRVAGVAGTKNCDWWFFEQAIIIDTAGRYAIPQDDQQDSDEWREFLRHLSKYRKKESLNGLVVTVAADQLLHTSFEELESDGRLIRERIEELMIQLGSRFPVYVMVTKSDLVQGMKEFCSRLPHVVHEQAFGYLNDDEKNQDCRLILKKAFEVLGERISQFRLRITNQAGHKGLNPKILLFPEEFSRLQKGLIPFFRGAFDETVYQEPPIIRGIYFTSAHQSGMPISHFIEDLGVELKAKDSEEAEEKEEEMSFFLHDFFARILPTDRYSFSRTRRAMARRRRIGIFGGVTWVITVLAMCILLSYSFYRDYHTIRQVKDAYGETPVMTGALLEDVETLEHVRSVINRLNHLNEHQYVPRFGLNHCGRVERDLKREFCNLLRHDFFAKYDKQMADNIVTLSDEDNSLIAHAAVHYIQRINLIERRLNDGVDVLASHNPMPEFRYLVLPKNGDVLPSTLEVIEDQYIHYLKWASTKEIVKERIELQKRLDYLVSKDSVSLNWMLAWCNEEFADMTVSYKDFWSVFDSMDAKTVEVQPSFTAQGYEEILKLQQELQSALPSELEVGHKLEKFDRFYKEQYVRSWNTFCDGFPNDVQSLSKDELSSVMRVLGTDRGPFISVLQKMVIDLEPIRETDSFPEWMEHVFEYTKIKELLEGSDKPNAIAEASKVVKKKPSILKRILRVKNAIPKTSEEEAILAGVYRDYFDGLSAISKVSLTTSSSLSLARETFMQDSKSGSSPVISAAQALKEIQISSDILDNENRLFAKLIRGPFDSLWDGICNQSAWALQKSWDEKVLADVGGIYDPNLLLESMFGARGKAVAFLQGEAAPFIGRDRARGYYAKEVAGNRLPLNDDFLQYLTRGSFCYKSETQVFDVMMEGVPTDVNPEALWMPSCVKFSLQCAEGDQSLENHNFPESHTFKWSPKNSGIVTLQIHIEDIILEKKYSGFRPFAQFVQDFETGTRKFVPSDFPEQKDSLERMGVEYIQVKYVIKGGAPVIELLDMEAGDVPEIIVTCLS